MIRESDCNDSLKIISNENNSGSTYNLNDSPLLFSDVDFGSKNKEFQNSEIMNNISSCKNKSNEIDVLTEKKIELEKMDGVIDSMISEFFALESEEEKNMELVTSVISENVEDIGEQVLNEICEEKMSMVSNMNISLQKQNEVEYELCQNIISKDDFSDEILSTITEEINENNILESQTMTNKEVLNDENGFSPQRKCNFSCILETPKDSMMGTRSKGKSVNDKLITAAVNLEVPIADSTSQINGNNELMNNAQNSPENGPKTLIESELHIDDENRQIIPESSEETEDSGCFLSEKDSCSEKADAELKDVNFSEDQEQIKEKNESTGGTVRNSIDRVLNCSPQYSNPFEIIVPLIGKSTFSSVGNLKPFTQRYDLARERNRLRAQHPDAAISTISYEEYRKQRDSRSKEQIDRDLKMKRVEAMKKAFYLTSIAIKILRELQKDEPSEEYIEKYFNRSQNVSPSYLALIYAPHFVHTVMFCRGCNNFSIHLRKVADECYSDCHAMFPIPFGYNFETVYASELKKNLPDEYEGINDVIPEYGDFDCPSSDSDDDNINLNNTRK